MNLPGIEEMATGIFSKANFAGFGGNQDFAQDLASKVANISMGQEVGHAARASRPRSGFER